MEAKQKRLESVRVLVELLRNENCDNKMRLETAEYLVNKLLNETIERWSQNEYGRCYMIRYCECEDNGFSLQPTHDGAFYSIDDYIDIAKACQLHFYVYVKENMDGILAPTLRIYY